MFLGFKISENSIFGGVSRWEKIVCHDASTTLFKVIRKLVSWVRPVNIRDGKSIIKIGLLFSEKYILGLIPCLLYQVVYDWKESAWAGRKKVKDAWGFVV